MPQFFAAAVIIAAFAAFGLCAQPSTRPSTRPSTAAVAATQPTDSERATATALARRLPEVNFNGTGLVDSLAFLSDVLGVKFDARWDVLEKAGVKKSSPIRARLSDARVTKILATILNDLQKDDARLTYAIQPDGTVIITTLDDYFANHQSVRTYDVSALINMPGLSVKERDERIVALIKLIQETIDPTNWIDCGGKYSKLEVNGTQLIVTTTSDNHSQLWNLLEQLREMQGRHDKP